MQEKRVLAERSFITRGRKQFCLVLHSPGQQLGADLQRALELALQMALHLAYVVVADEWNAQQRQ